MANRKNDFTQNIINFVESGDCGHQGLVYQFEEEGGLLYFANLTEHDYPQKTNSEMYVELQGLLKEGYVTFEYIVPGKMRTVIHEPIRNFYEYIY